MCFEHKQSREVEQRFKEETPETSVSVLFDCLQRTSCDVFQFDTETEEDFPSRLCTEANMYALPKNYFLGG